MPRLRELCELSFEESYILKYRLTTECHDYKTGLSCLLGHPGHFLICLLGHPVHSLICILGHPVHFLICLDLTRMFQFLKIETFPQFLVTHFSLLTTLFSVYSLIDFLIFILGEVVFNTNEQKTATVGRVPRVNRMSSFYGDLNSSSATLER